MLTKNSLKSVCAILTLAILLPAINAQEETMVVPIAPSAIAGTKKAGKENAAGLQKRVDQRDEQLVKKLQLTPEQKQQLAELRKTQAERLKAARGDRAAMAKLVLEASTEVRSLLTDDQKKKFDEMQRERPALRARKKAL